MSTSKILAYCEEILNALKKQNKYDSESYLNQELQVFKLATESNKASNSLISVLNIIKRDQLRKPWTETVTKEVLDEDYDDSGPWDEYPYADLHIYMNPNDRYKKVIQNVLHDPDKELREKILYVISMLRKIQSDCM